MQQVATGALDAVFSGVSEAVGVVRWFGVYTITGRVYVACDAAETGTRSDVICGAERVEKLANTFDQEIPLGTGGTEGASD